jgi:SAM-dependent methyltransferase
MGKTIMQIIAVPAAALLLGFTSAQAQPNLIDRAPFVPTPPDYVDVMLRLAAPGPGDVLYDLGSGDGRIPITAAQRFAVSKAVGVEIDPDLVRESTGNARTAGVSDRVRFVQGNVFEADFREATVVTIYLLQHLNLALKPKLLAQLKPGTRIVSYEFHLGKWLPDRTFPESTRRTEQMTDEDDAEPNVYLWIVPARVDGRWRITADDTAFDLNLTQSFQSVAGDMISGSRVVPLRIEPLVGERIRLSGLTLAGTETAPFTFEGRVEGESMQGTLTAGGRTVSARGERIRSAP